MAQPDRSLAPKEFAGPNLSMQNFIITSRANSKGVSLTSDSLSYPLWYATSAEAAKYARWVSRAHGCRIETRDERGALLLIEEIPPGVGFA
jgi:hypothetical protein